MDQKETAVQHGIPWPDAYRDLLPILRAEWDVEEEILLSRSLGGKSGALVFVADITCRGFSGQAILKLDQAPDSAWQEQSEAERHRRAFEETPDYAARRLPKLLHSLHHGNKLAILSAIAGGALEYAKPWAICPYAQQLSVTQQVSDGLLEDWNRDYSLSRGMQRPQDLLRAWLGYRIDPSEGRIHDFLEQDCGIAPTVPSLIYEGRWYPNPLAFATGDAPPPRDLQQRAITGNLHGDLNGFNVLVPSQTGDRPDYFLIDLAYYLPDQFLFYDHAYFELSLLVNAREGMGPSNWSAVLHDLRGNRVGEEKVHLEANDLGLVELARSCRQGVIAWVERHQGNRLANMESQYYLARVAAGLNFTNKPLPRNMRLMALTYAAANLKSFLKFNEMDWPKHGPELDFDAQSDKAEPASGGALSSALQDDAAQQPDDLTDEQQDAALAGGQAAAAAQGRKPGPKIWAGLGAAAVLAVVLAAGLWIWSPWLPRTETDAIGSASYRALDKPSIVVLPFESLSSGSESEMLAHSMTSAITAALAQVPDLFVTSRDSATFHDSQSGDLREVVKALGVRYVLDGDLQQTDSRVRVTAKLFDAESGEYAWAERYDRDSDDLFALQDEIALRVLVSLQVALTEGYQAAVRGEGTQNVQAYLLYTKAQSAFRSLTDEAMDEVQRLTDQILELDPNFRQAYVLQAWSHIIDSRFGHSGPDDESLAKAADLLRQAAALDGEMSNAERAEIQIADAYIAQKAERYDEALTLGEEAAKLAPNNADLLASYAVILYFSRDYDRSLAHLRRAMRLRPSYPSWYALYMSRNHVFKDNTDKAIDWAERGQARAESDLIRALHAANLVFAYEEADRGDEARTAAQQILELAPDFTVENYGRLQPYRYEEDWQRYADALKKAGVP